MQQTALFYKEDHFKNTVYQAVYIFYNGSRWTKYSMPLYACTVAYIEAYIRGIRIECISPREDLNAVCTDYHTIQNQKYIHPHQIFTDL